MTHQDWQSKYRDLKQRADRVSAMIHARAKQACKDAGLDPSLLGIHPHNAMVGLEYGKPWPDVNYHYCRLSIHLQEKQYEPYRILHRWDKRVRGY